ncbi:type II toxin-antitoxin system VapC family toxin [Brevundimonas sp. BT-123]|uniref:type II toxin-antitoxin system VapC family toxin n=1 Tax=Brevundimonas sp. BT-123 TaxID=2986928 RepID=UPI0022367713|nr:type II toxin-antitoxin system VapC family toxin [Brevundimonas sp. BT-123]MCW0046613.1 type II toxin-antitoxin system VapC family toxin [Brevundimonas sp. BT-123]
MRLLLDTHLLLWVAANSKRVPRQVADLIDDPNHILMFSVISLIEVAIKTARARPEFQVDAGRLRSMLLAAGYDELEVAGDHAIALGQLDPVHKDPFDRLLLAQAIVEGAKLVTADAMLARYPGPILKV